MGLAYSESFKSSANFLKRFRLSEVDSLAGEVLSLLEVEFCSTLLGPGFSLLWDTP